ncbi:MAG: energy transducer TonB [Bacteroidales bacterium]|nr:energy transducer TonB [Bacteroidales bacterium]
MTPIKTNQENLERKRFFFFEYGVLLILATLLAAFEWGKTLPVISEKDIIRNNYPIDVLIPVTRVEKTLPPPPVMPVELIIINDPLIDIDEPDNFLNVDARWNDPTNVYKIKPVDETAEVDSFWIVEEMPKYRNGPVQNFQKHVQELVKYPDDAMRMGLQGMVFLQFMVNEKGILINPVIVRSPDRILSDAVLLAVSKTENWTPGRQRKIPVKVNFTIPVKFALNEN